MVRVYLDCGGVERCGFDYWGGGGGGTGGSVLSTTDTSGVKVSSTWQKCSWRARC